MSVYHQDDLITLHHGKAEEIGATLAPSSVQTIVTSPPYFGLRDYGDRDQTGGEATAGEYVTRLVHTFRALRDALSDDGTLWLNLGDSYASSSAAGQQGRSDMRNGRRFTADKVTAKAGEVSPKNLLGIPWRVAFALQDDGWVLRSDIIWAKPNPMPESVTDRPTKAHEYLFLFAKRPNYYYDSDAIAEISKGTDHPRHILSGQPSLEPSGGINAPHRGLRKAEGREARPQLKRAWEKFNSAGLTNEHLVAMRAIGMNDAGKAREVQSGFGKNDPEMQRLADEAKAALGGYYREFLSSGTVNKRTVWTVPTVPFGAAHFAVYPPELIRPCILAGSRRGDTVLDPFSGSGTTGMVATQEGRRYVGIELNREYIDLSLRERFQARVLDLTGLEA